MRLAHALRLRPGMSVAFVGAGGKSAALACLAREAAGARPIILTTTTRIAREQSALAAHHLLLQERRDLESLLPWLAAAQSVIVTGPLTDGDSKWQGLDEDLLGPLAEEVQRAGGWLAIEADGARGRSLKVPAAHEPRLPGFIEIVAPLAGLDVVGTTIDGGRVHRPEDLSGFLGLPIEARIEEEAIAQVLVSPEGALKDIPSSAEIRPILNKIDSPGRLESAERIARRILEGEGPIPPGGATSRPQPGRIRSVLGARLADVDPILSSWGRIAGVVLAAGGSSRLEPTKPLVTFRGRPLILYAVSAALQAGLDPVTVVLGHAAEEVRRVLDPCPVRVVENPDWATGQASSVRVGLQDAAPRTEAVVFFLADMPFVSSATVRRLIQRHRETLMPIVAPAAGHRRGNPVLFDRSVFSSLGSLTGDTGGRVLFEKFAVDEVACEETELMDVDTPRDLERLWSME